MILLRSKECLGKSRGVWLEGRHPAGMECAEGGNLNSVKHW